MSLGANSLVVLSPDADPNAQQWHAVGAMSIPWLRDWIHDNFRKVIPDDQPTEISLPDLQ